MSETVQAFVIACGVLVLLALLGVLVYHLWEKHKFNKDADSWNSATWKMPIGRVKSIDEDDDGVRIMGEYFPGRIPDDALKFWSQMNGGCQYVGPEAFTDPEGAVISWRGENFYRACGKYVTGGNDQGGTTCVKHVNHPPPLCENYHGRVRDQESGAYVTYAPLITRNSIVAKNITEGRLTGTLVKKPQYRDSNGRFAKRPPD